MKIEPQPNKWKYKVSLFASSLLFISLNAVADWVQWEVDDGGNGHFYEVIVVPGGITWPDANLAALRRNHNSHLATITSEEENDFVAGLLLPFGYGWIGGIQTTEALNSSNGWRWSTGEAFSFINWGIGEPNDNPFDEIFLEINQTGDWNDCCGPIDVTRPLYIVESNNSAEIKVDINIAPANPENPVNPRSKGKVRLAILSSNDFDATTVDTNSVLFGPNEAAPVSSTFRDVNRDGDQDLLLKFNIPDTGIACGDTDATLTGETFSGLVFYGTDTIETVGCEH